MERKSRGESKHKAVRHDPDPTAACTCEGSGAKPLSVYLSFLAQRGFVQSEVHEKTKKKRKKRNPLRAGRRDCKGFANENFETRPENEMSRGPQETLCSDLSSLPSIHQLSGSGDPDDRASTYRK
jgi:hypothetical protein